MSPGGVPPDPRYVTDVPYARQFVRELSPAWLDFSTLICGFAPPNRDRSFAWCELGCGHGVTPVFLAAAYPEGRFTGIDLMAEHIVFAETLAREAEIGNVDFAATDFATAAAKDGPGFDYIVAHGVYTWVDQAAQRDLVRFIARRLNPGGLVYISYDCLPGWAGDMPLQNMLLRLAERREGDSIARLDDADRRLRGLMAAGASVLRLGAMGHEWEALRRQLPAHYFVHQLLPPAWQPLYVTDVRNAFREIGLAPIGSATIRENVDAFTLDRAAQDVVAAEPDPDLRELMRDYLLQKRFRRDLFVRAPVGLDANEARRRLLEGQYRLPPEHREGGASISLNDPVARRIVELLAAGLGAPADLLREGLPVATIVAQLIALAAAGQVWPVAPTTADAFERLNAIIRRRAGTADEIAFLGIAGGMAAALDKGLDKDKRDPE